METIGFTDAFKYPFNRPKRLLYGLWVLIPVIGWLALFGYIVRVVNEFIDGKYEELPRMYFTDDLKLGFSMFLKSLPFFILYFVLLGGIAVLDEDVADILSFLLNVFVTPVLTVNFYRKQTIMAYFDFGIFNSVIDNIGDYMLVLVKHWALSLIFLILTIVLAGIPALFFTSFIFVANFYGRRLERQTFQIM